MQAEAPRRRFAYPVTVILGFQYIALIFVPSILKDRPWSFVYWVPLFAIGVTFYVELIARHFKSRPAPGKLAPSARAGFVIGCIGVLALVERSRLGSSTVATQLGATETSPLARFITPFGPWIAVGVGIIIYAWGTGRTTRRNAVTLLVILLVVSTLAGLYLAGYSSAFLLVAFPAAVGGLVMRVVKIRYLVAGTIVLFLVWPNLLQTRNDIRASYFGPRTARTVANPYYRLQDDDLLALAADIDLPHVSPLTVLHQALVPSVIDPQKPTPNIGRVVSLAAEGNPVNSLTLTTFGGLWAMGGLLAVLVYTLAVTITFASLIRRGSPWAFVVMVAIAPFLIAIEPMYPDNVVLAIQSCLSTAAAYIAWRGAVLISHIRFTEPRPGRLTIQVT